MGGGALARRRVARRRGSVRAVPALLLGSGLLLALAVPGTAAAQTDPLDEAEAAVAAARAEADAAAGSYFELLNRAEVLEAQVAANEANVQEMRTQAAELRRRVQARAASAYLRSGATSIEFGLHSDEQALEVARRSALLNRLNRSDNEVAEQLAELTAALEQQRLQLAADRAAYEETLDLLREEQAQLDVKLANAQARRNDVIARQQAAAAREAANAAASPPSESTTPTAPTAPAAPVDYEPTPGEHPQHWDPFLLCTRTVESGGNYQAYSPDGPYYGAYQFLQSTWNVTANHAGRGELIGVVPSTASEYDQDDMAWALYQWQGKGPWGDRC